MLDYQNFQVIRCHIKGILVYMLNMTVTGNEASCTGETSPKIRSSGKKQMASIGTKNEIFKKC
jgi:hypothetical protein